MIPELQLLCLGFQYGTLNGRIVGVDCVVSEAFFKIVRPLAALMRLGVSQVNQTIIVAGFHDIVLRKIEMIQTTSVSFGKLVQYTCST